MSPSSVPKGYPAGSRVAAKVVLDTVRLSEARLEVGTPPSAGQREVEVDINLRTAWEVGEDHLDAQVGVWVRLLPVGEPEGEPLVSIVVEYVAEYSIPSDLQPSDDELQAFVEQSAVLTAWPYMRETVHGLAGRAGVPQLVLPIHKVSLPTPVPAKKVATKKTATKKPAAKTAVTKKRATKKAPAGTGTRRGVGTSTP